MKKLFRYTHDLLAMLLIAIVATLVFVPTAHAGPFSDYTENKLVDAFFRGQAFTMPATQYIALATTAGSDAACGTEVSTSSTGYARVAVTGSLANWAGTQSAGSTTASSGTSGQTSNNVAITWGAPTAPWGQVVEVCAFDSSTSGNLLWRVTLTAPKTINSGDSAPSFPVGTLTFTWDN